MEPWEQKAHKIISELSREAYKKANLVYKNKAKPYRIPAIASELVEILGMHDKVEAEERAKYIFIKLAIIPDCAND